MGLTQLGGQMAERLGSRAINKQVAGSIISGLNYVVSLGKALHSTCLSGMFLYFL